MQSLETNFVCWSLNEIPTVGFYRELHRFLKKWPISRSATKTAIGNFYISIDPELQKKSTFSRPDNIYRFIEKVADSDKPDATRMCYNLHATIQRLQTEIIGCSAEIQGLSATVQNQKQELCSVRKEVDIAKAELGDAKRELQDIEKQLQCARRERKKAERNNEKLQAGIVDAIHYEDELLDKIDLLCSDESSKNGGDENSFCFQTKRDGKVYSPAIRDLYYTLLANQLPPAKIAPTIRTILNCFLPHSVDVQIPLPGRSCASYMRKTELTTINLAHKASVIIEQEKPVHLNTDGTTKSQKKLQGVAINGMVLSINEVPDGAADAMIDDISSELQKLREIAHSLGLPNADKINWTLIASSSSDSASTQKRFNKLLQDQKKKDEEKFGTMCPGAMELVENFCCMHLGVNLRKAFLDGMKAVANGDSNDSQQREHHKSDTFVHEFCKLLGQHGVPEYGHGNLAFPDFLEERSTSSEKASYYQTCLRVKLDRQVGSRYFVTAANAGKILFLQEAAVDFLQYCGKSADSGNKLEQTVFKKLQDPDELSQLKGDAVMFHHVYSNLVMLAKSTDLNKSAFDMNKHYLELQLFLEQVQLNPQIAMDKEFQVFSEKRLYSDSKTTNHRLHPLASFTEERVFHEDEWDETLLYPLLSAGAVAMKEKLCTYAQTQLPGGKYWEPDSSIEMVLKQLRPNNDLCESILGLNDYLATTIPNLHQQSKSNLIQVKKNKTMRWLHELPDDKHDTVIELAVKRRKTVTQLDKEGAAQRSKLRREKMVRENCRREALKRRAAREKDRLSTLHLITSTDELKKCLSDIGCCKKKKLALIRDQINIRKKLLNQRVKVYFSHKGRERPLEQIIQDLIDAIECFSASECTDFPESFVGKNILHKFEVDGQEKWFAGHILSYDTKTHLHEVLYDEEDENLFFNLTDDISNGDLLFVDESV